jgi:HD-GYP domain-containing protein (c-di-GMP phosphodiesterase class II)
MEYYSWWVLAHHVRPEGQGYPPGLAGVAIPLEALILAVCDAYEAMISDRPYRRAPGHAFAVQELRRGQGTQFATEVVDALLASMNQDGADAVGPPASAPAPPVSA